MIEPRRGTRGAPVLWPSEVLRATRRESPFSQIQKLREPFQLERGGMVGDRGLLTEKLLDPIVKATRRETNPLRGKENLALRAGKRINPHKMGQCFKLNIRSEKFPYERKTEPIKPEAARDGFYVARTSVPSGILTAEHTVYKKLSGVERAFRCIKTVDLNARPIFHPLEKRVRAHLFL